MKKNVLRVIVVFAALSSLLPGAFAAEAPKVKLKEYQSPQPANRPVLQRWTGDFPVAHLNRLPAGQSQYRVGYIGDAETFASVWQVFKPGTALPQVDFNKNLVVFARNVKSYHPMLVEKVAVKDGVASIVYPPSLMPAPPVEDKVAMGLALISREGLKFIQADKAQIPVR